MRGEEEEGSERNTTMYNINSGFGALQAQALHGIKPGLGKLFFVGDSGTVDLDRIQALFGYDPDGELHFFATIDAAISACVANRNDTILVAPGHTETVTATSIALDVAGVSIIGLGEGSLRPTLTYGAAAATITVSAANCSVSNILHVANFDNVAAAYTVTTGKYFTLQNNEFSDNSNALHFLSVLVTNATDNAADGLKVLGNKWIALAVAPNAFVSILAAEKDVTISDNYCDMAATNDVGHFLTIAAKVMTAIRVERNVLVVVGATDATVGVFMTGSSTTNTGFLAYNLVTSLDTTTELITTAALNLALFENYYTGTKTASAKLWPAVDGA